MSRFATLVLAATSALALTTVAAPAPAPAPATAGVTPGSVVLAGGAQARVGGSWCC